MDRTLVSLLISLSKYEYLSTLILASALLLYVLKVENSEVRKRMLRFPGPPTLPILGNVQALLAPIKGSINMVEAGIATYGNRCRVVLGPNKYFLFLTHPDDLKVFQLMAVVLSSSKILNKTSLHNLIHPWLAINIASVPGEEWYPLRKLLGPAFHVQSLPSFQAVFNTQSQILIETLRDKVKAGQSEQQPLQMFTRYATATLLGTLMGTKINILEDPNEPYSAAIYQLLTDVGSRVERPWLYIDAVFRISKLWRHSKANLKFLYTFIDKIISTRKAEELGKQQKPLPTANSNGDSINDVNIRERRSFMELLLNPGNNGGQGLPPDEVRSHMLSFMLAGIDTTANAMFWTLLLLAENPEEQEKLHAELDAVFGNDRRRPLTMSDLSQLKHLDCCIKEGLRLYPSLPGIGRRTEQEFQLDSDTIIPKGVDVIITPYFTHRLAEFFPEPLEFRPSRHLPENSSTRHPYAFIPFSAGPRNCIAQKFALLSEKILLASVFRNFRVTPIDRLENIKPIFSITIKPDTDARCAFHLRN